MTIKFQKRDEWDGAVRIPIEDMVLHGDPRLPPHAMGLVIFVHGSGSSQFSQRNRYVAEALMIDIEPVVRRLLNAVAIY
ncbi:MAG TPA: hypothetical protein VKW06_11545 [Candidatus Angelobacter sp.]|nr:hypothetical protein [Candidatus Angelobacter sp.]